ncbi:prepilin-type N-terminal cleavage/methylation domain-containing protein [Candidatus Falkowbacteria bacterium]|nr:prepilin-type N-terminal cleavage/methylation domain-containing protein [Candidatus Falkowbacteria bacterium]
MSSNFKKKLRNKKGFTLTELLISVVVGLLIIIIVTSSFILNQRTFRKGDIKSELAQNARITIDLMAREIRQAKKIVTVLPVDDSDPGLIAHDLEFEDGHIETQIQYIKYYLDDGDLKRQIIVYYFDTDPSTYVHWDDVDSFGGPSSTVLQEKVTGENFSNINFYGSGNINIEMALEKQNEEVEVKSIINPRNI